MENLSWTPQVTKKPRDDFLAAHIFINIILEMTEQSCSSAK